MKKYGQVVENIFSLENMTKLLNRHFKNKEVEAILFNGVNQYISIDKFMICVDDGNNQVCLRIIDRNREEPIVLYILDKDMMYCQFDNFSENAFLYLTNQQIIQLHVA